MEIEIIKEFGLITTALVLVVYVGGRYLISKFVDNRFNENIEEHKQAIAHIYDKQQKLYEMEMKILPTVWKNICDSQNAIKKLQVISEEAELPGEEYGDYIEAKEKVYHAYETALGNTILIPRDISNLYSNLLEMQEQFLEEGFYIEENSQKESFYQKKQKFESFSNEFDDIAEELEDLIKQRLMYEDDITNSQKTNDIQKA